MSDEPPILVECTKVSVINSDDERSAALLSPESCLNILHRHSGNLIEFVRYFNANDPADQQRVLYAAEQMMKTDKEKYKEWKSAILINQTVRIELLQATALNRLEGNKVGFEEKYTDRAVTLKYKEMDDISFAKLVLGDAFAGRIAKAKFVPRGPKSDGSDGSDFMDDDDDDAIERAMGDD